MRDLHLRDAALRYAARGLHVFPVRPRDKRPACHDGCKAATTDRDQVAQWWRATPNANIGITAGPSGLLVVDVDGPAGVEALRAHDVPITWTARTPRGWHVFFDAPDGADLGPRVAVLPSVDVRAGWSYIVAPPSMHPSGVRYRWARGRGMDDVDLAAVPAWLLEQLQQEPPQAPGEFSEAAPPDPDRDSAYARKVLEEETRNVRRAPKGQRNHRLNHSSFAVGRRVAVGLIDYGRARDALVAAAIEAGLGKREATLTTTSGLAAGMKLPKPRPERAA